jgi:hypothetical protein
MMDAATREQQLLLDSRNYVAVTATANFPNTPSSGGINLAVPAATSGKYDFAVTVDNAANPPAFLITGTATNDQAVDGNLTLSQTGAKTPVTKW